MYVFGTGEKVFCLYFLKKQTNCYKKRFFKHTLTKYKLSLPSQLVFPK